MCIDILSPSLDCVHMYVSNYVIVEVQLWIMEDKGPMKMTDATFLASEEFTVHSLKGSAATWHCLVFMFKQILSQLFQSL